MTEETFLDSISLSEKLFQREWELPYMQEGHTSGLAPVLVLPAAWKGCFAVAAPEVLHLPAGEEFYFASVKY